MQWGKKGARKSSLMFYFIEGHSVEIKMFYLGLPMPLELSAALRQVLIFSFFSFFLFFLDWAWSGVEIGDGVLLCLKIIRYFTVIWFFSLSLVKLFKLMKIPTAGYMADMEGERNKSDYGCKILRCSDIWLNSIYDWLCRLDHLLSNWVISCYQLL